MGAVARIGGALGAAVAWTLAMTREGMSDSTTAMFAIGALLLVAVVLFIPSETPVRRLGQLIQAWRIPAEAPCRDPAQFSDERVAPPADPGSLSGRRRTEDR